jgi:hypothetical protein
VTYRNLRILSAGLILSSTIPSVVWRARPSTLTASLFAAVLMTGLILINRTYAGLTRLLQGLVIFGAASNMAVIIANGGYMPALPRYFALYGPRVERVYKVVTPETHLVLLCDRLTKYGASIGDFFLVIGAVLTLAAITYYGPKALRQD